MRLGVGVHGLATRSSYGCRRRRRHRWALTPPFHPYRCPLRIAAVVFCYDLHELAPVWQFHQCGALCCPDFPLLPIHPKASEAAAEPPCFYLIELYYLVRLLPGKVLFFLTSLRSFSSSPLGNLQTMFALPSLAASVVNKKNQKNFRRMLAHPPAAGDPTLGLSLGRGFFRARIMRELP